MKAKVGSLRRQKKPDNPLTRLRRERENMNED